MSLATDLLEQAAHLAGRERGRPKQASLRRAISCAYYSLFHLLIDDAANFLVGAKLAPAVARSFEHQAMRTSCVTMAELERKPAQKSWLRAHAALPLDPKLLVVLDAFVDLQEQRHNADYDTAASFTRVQGQSAVGLANDAHRDWVSQRTTHNARVFQLASAKLLRPIR